MSDEVKDHGNQYCSNDFQKILKMYSSMSRKGDCWDNAVAESFFGSLKTERVFFNNHKRLHSYLGNISPKMYEKLWKLKKAA